jgi:hypothetical protein
MKNKEKEKKKMRLGKKRKEESYTGQKRGKKTPSPSLLPPPFPKAQIAVFMLTAPLFLHVATPHGPEPVIISPPPSAHIAPMCASSVCAATAPSYTSTSHAAPQLSCPQPCRCPVHRTTQRAQLLVAVISLYRHRELKN